MHLPVTRIRSTRLGVSLGCLALAACRPCEDIFYLDYTYEPSQTNAALRAVAAFYQLNVTVPDPKAIVVGDAGTILTRSQDGAWSVQESGTNEDLFAGEWAANLGSAIHEYVNPFAYYPPEAPNASREWIAIDGSIEAWAISSNAILHIEAVRELCPERGG